MKFGKNLTENLFPCTDFHDLLPSATLMTFLGCSFLCCTSIKKLTKYLGPFCVWAPSLTALPYIVTQTHQSILNNMNQNTDIAWTILHMTQITKAETTLVGATCRKDPWWYHMGFPGQCSAEDCGTSFIVFMSRSSINGQLSIGEHLLRTPTFITRQDPLQIWKTAICWQVSLLEASQSLGSYLVWYTKILILLTMYDSSGYTRPLLFICIYITQYKLTGSLYLLHL